jgi:hypothetical protein
LTVGIACDERRSKPGERGHVRVRLADEVPQAHGQIKDDTCEYDIPDKRDQGSRRKGATPLDPLRAGHGSRSLYGFFDVPQQHRCYGGP